MKLWIKILIGLALGVIIGEIIRLAVGTKVEIIERIGNAFIDLLKMVVGLVIFSSIVTGMCHISNPKALGRIGLCTLAFYAITTLIAIFFGLCLVFFLQPGVGLNLSLPAKHLTSHQGVGLLDFLFGVVPSNPFSAFTEGNVLQVIVFSIFFSIAIILSKEKGKPVLELVESLSEVMYSLTHFIMRFAPYGVCALMATTVTSIGPEILVTLLKFLACNYIASLLQICFVFCFSLKYLAKVGVIPFFKGMKEALVVAFTTGSSSATLPVSLECARYHLGLSADISGFVLSLGSTINMNGTAIGQSISAIFIAQVYGIELSWVQVGILIFVSLISAVGAAGIPGTGIIMLSVVLNAMGLPLEGIALIAGVDRLREMVSTVVNVLGDAVAAVFVATKEKQIDLKKYHAATWLS